MLETLQAVVAIILIDLTLSGDNAIVIGMAARGLPHRRRRGAIVFGGLAAVAVRIGAASLVTVLLHLSYVQLIAAIVLVVIAYRMVRDTPSDGGIRGVAQASTLRGAVATILVADITMGSDNVVGVGAAAQGSVPLLAFGLALSIPIVLFGSALVVRLLDRFPHLIWLGVLALLWTAAELIVGEPAISLEHALPLYPELAICVVLLFVVVALRSRSGRRTPLEAAPSRSLGPGAAD